MSVRKEIVDQLIIWIEENLEVKLNQDLMAERTGYSKWHLQRIFKIETGVTLGHYVLKRKMFNSAKEIQETNVSIFDIAMNYGYDSQQSFCRAFKSIIGMTPTAWRRKNFKKT